MDFRRCLFNKIGDFSYFGAGSRETPQLPKTGEGAVSRAGLPQDLKGEGKPLFGSTVNILTQSAPEPWGWGGLSSGGFGKAWVKPPWAEKGFQLQGSGSHCSPLCCRGDMASKHLHKTSLMSRHHIKCPLWLPDT